MTITITLVIVIVTSLVSLGAFSNYRIQDDLIFYPPSVNRGQWYRFFSCGLIHADYFHLIFNMFALYSFGESVELGHVYSSTKGLVEDNGFIQIFGEVKGKGFYLLLYLLALPFSMLPSYIRNRNNYHYRSLGASGAVSAVVFAGLLLEPRAGVGVIFIPNVSIPGYIFGPVYLVISHILSRKGRDNINHSAHIWGSVFGIVFTLVMTYFLSDFNAMQNFIDSIRMDTGL